MVKHGYRFCHDHTLIPDKVGGGEHWTFDAATGIAANRLLDACVARSYAADHVSVHRNPTFCAGSRRAHRDGLEHWIWTAREQLEPPSGGTQVRKDVVQRIGDKTLHAVRAVVSGRRNLHAQRSKPVESKQV